MTNAIEQCSAIQARIATAAGNVGRPASDVTLIAVTKTFEAGDIRPVLDAGHRHFGENRVQEANAKWPLLRADYAGIVLHLIGPLQSNKAETAVSLFDAIHTIDRDKIAAAIAAEIASQNRAPYLFVQVNTGEEPQKAGILPHDAAAFVDRCRTTHGLVISGLMCIPPVDEEPAIHFALLRKLAREVGVEGLSMGMSGDFETAVELGATHVRVGSAIFGTR
ncbi:MAG: YggS family pyridoxal phosphate-dependent enzyme [Hyphomicrobiaceae bacterium]|nr:YggS family pyridoxal phosphate-dependent enzyme [Hyphomicrobiaceae bacterium]